MSVNCEWAFTYWLQILDLNLHYNATKIDLESPYLILNIIVSVSVKQRLWWKKRGEFSERIMQDNVGRGPEWTESVTRGDGEEWEHQGPGGDDTEIRGRDRWSDQSLMCLHRAIERERERVRGNCTHEIFALDSLGMARGLGARW